MELENVKKSSNVARIVLNIIKIIFIIACVLLIVAGIALIAKNDYVNQVFSQGQMDVNDVSIDFNLGSFSFAENPEELLAAGKFGTQMGIYSIGFGIVCAFCVVITNCLTSIFKSIKDSESPFSEEVIRKLRKVFILISVVMFIGEGIGNGALCAVICWCIYTIFKYGYVLQKQADETL